MSEQNRREIARVVISIQQPGEGLEPDITTRFEYGDASPYPGVLAVSASEQEDVVAPASGVAITPQTATDQRQEMMSSSARNRALANVDILTGEANSRYSLAALGKSGMRSDIDAEALEGRAQNFENQAKKELSVACGNCALTQTCQISNNYAKWARVHNPSTSQRQTSVDQEPRDEWRRRLLADPEAPCLPPKPSSSKKDD